MFHFSQPLWLWLAALIPPVLWIWSRHRRSILRHPNLSLFPAETRRRLNPANWGGILLRGLALLALIGALAQPRWRDEKTRIETEGIAIGMIVDVSGSMGDRGFPSQKGSITRLDAVKATFSLFVNGGKGPGGIHLKGRPNDEIGLIVFGEYPDLACPLTLEHRTLVRALNAQEPRTLTGESGTNVIDAVVWGLTLLDRSKHKRRVLVLLTDGEDTVTRKETMMDLTGLITSSKSLGVPVYTIDAAGTKLAGLTEKERQESAVKRKKVQESLQKLAAQTGGDYFPVDSTDSLMGVYRTIDQKERERIQSFQVRRYHEGYPWFALGGLVLYQLVMILERTLWRRVP